MLSHAVLCRAVRAELSTLDKRALIRKGWEFNIKRATVGVSAEARLNLVEDTAAGACCL
jgi:hypothetical protein